MKLASTISIAILATVSGANSVLAQAAPTPEKQFSIGPTIEFGGASTSFGIQGKASVSPEISIRPLILFGYKPSISRSSVNQAFVDSTVRDAARQGVTITPAQVQAGLDSSANYQTDLPNIINSIGNGTAYGLAITYDFKSPDSKIVGYVGPRILFGSASGSGTLVNGNKFSTSANETSIGLTAGADYAISPDFTAGVNATYNFSRSGTGSYTETTPTITRDPINSSISGATFNVGLNFGYRF
jgi:opacity protein-like surface antigen